MEYDKKNILNYNLEDLKVAILSLGEKPYRASQVFEWIYKKNILNFKDMINLPAFFRTQLEKMFDFGVLELSNEERSSDGTGKFLFELRDGEKVETAFIPSSRRATVCLSTQAGCKFACRFCASGIGGLARDLEPGEIIAQFMAAKSEARKLAKALTHVVFMGTGEPFDNYDNVVKSARLLNDKDGANIGARRITISTVGIIPSIKKFMKEDIQIELAISLHGYDNVSRNSLMPVNRKYPFDDLIKACRDYADVTKRQITFEYILIKDMTVNDDAVKKLSRALNGMNCKMNLIPYNNVSEFKLEKPSIYEINNFRDKLIASGIHATIRTPRGRDISAACGQLRHEEKK